MRRIADLPYREPGSVACSARCTADLYLPDAAAADCVVWLHGGGLVEGDKGGPGSPVLLPDGFALVSANYRLLQHEPFPACLEDAAAVVAWSRGALAAQGVACRRLFVAGSSAGAYLAAMVALDPSWLAGYGASPSTLAGAIPLSGQMASHFAYRTSIGHHPDQPLVDRMAPLWHARKDAPPLLLIAGSDDMPCRPEENLYLRAAMRTAGHRHTACHIIPGRDHGTIGSGFCAPGDASDPVTRLIHAFLADPSRTA